MYSTYKYIAKCLIICLFTATVHAQKASNDSIEVPLWQGFELETDIVPLATNFLNDSRTFRYEASVRFNLQNKYYPVVEAGYEGHHKALFQGINYDGQGMFYRLGVDLNLMRSASATPLKNKLLVGARLAMSHQEYNIREMRVRNQYTNTNERLDILGLDHQSFWFEIVAGIRINIFKGATLGWTVRNKNPIGQAAPGELNPWYIPGYGISGDGVWSFNYIIGYQF
jgi:hypothetical protein